MATEVREHEERSHSARYLILIFLVCVATCAVFFSLGFVVGYNEHASRSVPSTEVVTAPPVIPPTINPPAESSSSTSPETATGRAAAAPDTGTAPSGGAESNSPLPAPKPSEVAPPVQQPPAAAKPASNPPSPPTPDAGEVGEGITLQVAALRTKQDAEALVDILKGRGYPVFLVTPEYAHADDNLFRVQVGPFKTRDDADKVRNKLSQEGFKPFIRH
ncbi:MAG: SPOR domain-containing protein [Terriglobia bacterium]